MGGKIEVESQVGLGSKFTFFFKWYSKLNSLASIIAVDPPISFRSYHSALESHRPMQTENIEDENVLTNFAEFITSHFTFANRVNHHEDTLLNY